MIGRGHFDHLAGVETIKDFKNIRSNLKILSLASSVVELFLYDQERGGKYREFDLLESIFSFLDNLLALSRINFFCFFVLIFPRIFLISFSDISELTLVGILFISM